MSARSQVTQRYFADHADVCDCRQCEAFRRAGLRGLLKMIGVIVIAVAVVVGLSSESCDPGDDVPGEMAP